MDIDWDVFKQKVSRTIQITAVSSNTFHRSTTKMYNKMLFIDTLFNHRIRAVDRRNILQRTEENIFFNVRLSWP